MMILVIDTSSEKTQIAIVSEQKKLQYIQDKNKKTDHSKEKRPGFLVYQKTWQGLRNQSEKLLIEIDRLIRKHRLTVDKLTAIAVVRGLGSYTGLRVGIVTANFLGWVFGKPLISIEKSQEFIPINQLITKNINSKKQRFDQPIYPLYPD
jgi:tRNA threonylcarbamoyl adenosine modification protein YeaZ